MISQCRRDAGENRSHINERAVLAMAQAGLSVMEDWRPGKPADSVEVGAEPLVGEVCRGPALPGERRAVV